MTVVLKGENLRTQFRGERGLVKVVDGVSYDIREGETLGLVGESGCGKTTVGRCTQRLYRPMGERILFEGQDIARLSENKLETLRRKMVVVFQDSYGSLNPRLNAGRIVGEPMKVHRLASSKKASKEKVEEPYTLIQAT